MHERCAHVVAGLSNPPASLGVYLWRHSCQSSPSWTQQGSGKPPQGILKEAQTMTDAANPSGLTDEEAQEFHTYYIQG
ncbi:MAG: hypothetical protein WCL48_12785, partial [Betaproteobacteria bacterium]